MSRAQRRTTPRNVPKLLETSPDGLSICCDGIVLYINKSGSQLLGIGDPAGVQGQALASFLHPDYRMLCDENFAALMDEPAATPMKILRPSGEFLDVLVSVQENPDNSGEVVVSIRDISAFMRANREVAAQLKRLNNILDTAVDAIVVCDEGGKIQTFNRAAVAMFGSPTFQMIGRSLNDLFETSPNSPTDERFDLVQQPFLLAGRGHEFTARRRDGSTFPAEISLSVCQLDTQRLFTAMIRDITERRGFENNLAHSATHDGLTGLPNRALLQERLQNILQKGVPEGTFIAVWFLDLGGLKVVNDVLGHDAGDELLILAGQRMLESVGPTDTVARFGGDEFALIVQGFTGEVAIIARVEKFLEAITAQPYSLKGREVTLNVTAGIAVYPHQATDTQSDLLLDASAAMMFAKTGGRNQFRFFEPAMHRQSADRLMLENELRRGIERGELLLHYQPQVEAKTGRIVGLEALVRWCHPTMGLVQPARFIPISEQTGLIVPLGVWVLRQASKDLRRLEEAGFDDISIAVNLSAKQFSDSDVVALVQEVIAENGIQPRHLDLEITESALMNDPENVVRYLERLKTLGVSLSIDDFGTGYSSLSYLKRFPVDTLKIDQSFIAEIASNTKDEAIAVTIITMAHAMGMTALAEGVEENAQTDILLHHGCDVIQGYLYSRPLPFDNIIETLRRGAILPIRVPASVD